MTNIPPSVTYLDKYNCLISGVNMDMSAIVGFVAGEEGRELLLWILLLVPNSFLKRTAFPYVKPNLV